LRLDIENIRKVLFPAIPESVGGVAKGFRDLVRADSNFGQGLFAGHGPDLKETQFRSLIQVGTQVHGKFQLHLAAHTFLGNLQDIREDLSQGVALEFEHLGKGEELGAGHHGAVADTVFNRTVSAGQQLDRVLPFGFRHLPPLKG